MSYVKAKIMAKNAKPPVDMEVMFNPKELQIDKTVTWTPATGAVDEAIGSEFDQPTPAALTVTLYFDTYEEKVDVYDKYIKDLERTAFMQAKDCPPLTIFQYGSLVFQGVVESLSQKYTMFLESGMKVRCEVALKMHYAKDVTKKSSTTSGTKNKTGPGAPTA